MLRCGTEQASWGPRPSNPLTIVGRPDAAACPAEAAPHRTPHKPGAVPCSHSAAELRATIVRLRWARHVRPQGSLLWPSRTFGPGGERQSLGR
jgi:hypothetical protein